MNYLLAVNIQSPLFWGIIVGWILSVTLHEFGHGLVAYLGGDYTIPERGGLSLNPAQYADPIMTFVLPVMSVLIGGLPLVGGATLVRRDLLRNLAWQSAVSVAGPAMNLLLFFICVIPLYPRFGWIQLGTPADSWSQAQVFCGAMAVLQLFGVMLNLLPIPGLDGFGIISPFLPVSVQALLGDRNIRFGCLIVLFMLFYNKQVVQLFYTAIDHCLSLIGFDWMTIDFIGRSFNLALFGHTGF